MCINKTNNFYSPISNDSWTLEFKGVPKDSSYSYDLQLQIIALSLDNFLNEEYLVYKIESIWANTTKIEGGFDKKLYIAIFVPIGSVIIGVALFFIIKYFRLKKKSNSFAKEVKSLLFSNDIQKNVLVKEQQLSKNESDYENTFI